MGRASGGYARRMTEGSSRVADRAEDGLTGAGTRIRLYRGLAVTPAQAAQIHANPTAALGSMPATVRGSMFDFRPVLAQAFATPGAFGLFVDMTQTPIAYGTTDLRTASMYARHRAQGITVNGVPTVSPMVVSFSAFLSDIFVDPNDFPVDAFVSPLRSPAVEVQKVQGMRELFGPTFAQEYAARCGDAWLDRRVVGHALCFTDEVIRFHLASSYVLRGRSGVQYVNAFGAFLPTRDVVVETPDFTPQPLPVFSLSRVF